MAEPIPLPAGFEGLERFRASSATPGAPTTEELERPIVAPGTDALLSSGVVYQAGWEPAADGLARHARAQVRALSKAGIPVALQSLPTTRMMLEDEIDENVKKEVGYLRSTSVGRAPFAIRQIIIHNHQFLENVVVPAGARLAEFENELKVYQSTVVYTSWERDTVHPEIVAVLNRCARVWVPCEMNARVFRNAGVDNVDVIPFPFDPDTSPAANIGAPRGSEAVPDGKRFYAIGKWEPRKNYDTLIGAFLTEFRPTERVSLFLKTHEWGAWKDYPTVFESLERWLGEPAVIQNGWTRENYRRRVRIVTKKIPDDKILKIHRDNNIYVTCSHGEAWDLPAFDARLAGNRLVYTGWGGADDYAGSRDQKIILAPEQFPGLVPVNPGYGWEANAKWSPCGLTPLRAALRKVEPPERRMLPPWVYPNFGAHVVGQKMVESLRKISPKAVDALVSQGGFG